MVLDDIKIGVIQMDIIWEDAQCNLAAIDHMIDSYGDAVDVLVLPEMFHSGFTMHPERVAQEEGGVVLSWMKNKAVQQKACVMGSVVYRYNGVYYNRLVVYRPDGVLNYYDKRHLFSIGGENVKYQAGQERLVFEYKGWKICPLICYDLRFPVWSRNDVDYDVLVYVANWPGSRRDVWLTLLKARALENQSYVVGVNRIGKDADHNYSGDSMVYDPRGQLLLNMGEQEEGLSVVALSNDDLLTFRKKFPVLGDRDKFKVDLS